MGKRSEYGHAAGKGVVGGVTKWVVGALLVALFGTGIGIAASDDDDDQVDQPGISQQEEYEDD